MILKRCFDGAVQKGRIDEIERLVRILREVIKCIREIDIQFLAIHEQLGILSHFVGLVRRFFDESLEFFVLSADPRWRGIHVRDAYDFYAAVIARDEVLECRDVLVASTPFPCQALEERVLLKRIRVLVQLCKSWVVIPPPQVLALWRVSKYG